MSDNKIVSLKYFLKWVNFIALYFLAYLNVKDLELLKKSLKIAVYLAAFIALIGLAEYVAGIDRVMAWFKTSSITSVIMEPETIKHKLLTGQTDWTTPIGVNDKLAIRVFGTFESSISFSAYLGLMLPFLIIMSKVNPLQLRNRYIILCVMLAAMFLTFARSAYLSLFITGIVLGFILVSRENIRKVLLWIITVILLVSATVSIYRPIRVTIEERLSRKMPVQFTRKYLWASGMDIFLARPILGTGIANYSSGFKKYVIDSPDLPPRPAHNQYIQLAAETGVFGLVSYLLIMIFGMKYSLIMSW